MFEERKQKRCAKRYRKKERETWIEEEKKHKQRLAKFPQRLLAPNNTNK